MPRVPRYDAPQVKEAGMPDVRFSTSASGESFGAGQAKDIQQLGGIAERTGLKLYEAQQREDNQLRVARVREKHEQSQQELNRYVQTEVEPLTGEAATHSYDLVNEKAEEIRQKYGQGLTDERDRAMFDASFSDYKTGVLGSVGAFEAKHKKAYVAATLDAENNTANKSAQQYRDNPQLVNYFHQTVKANTASKYEGDPLKEQYVKEAEHNYFSGIVEAAFKSSPKEGRETLELYKDKLDVEGYSSMKAGIEKAVISQEINDRSDALGRLPLGAQEKAIESIQNPEVRKGVRHEVGNINAAKEHAQKKNEEYFYKNEANKLLADPAGYQVPYSGFPDQQLRLASIKDALLKPKAVTTDWNYYNEVMHKNADDFQSTKLDASKLAPTEFKKLVDIQVKGKGFDESQSLNQWMSTFIKAETGGDMEKAGALRAEAEKMLNMYPPQERGKAETRNKVKDSLLMAVIAEGEDHWYMPSSKRYEALAGKKKILRPANAELPPGLPENAQWIEGAWRGKVRRGWKYTNPAGVVKFHDFDLKEDF